MKYENHKAKVMNSFIEYTVKSGIALLVLYALYWLLLRNDTHFRLNRAVLLISLFVSLVLPAIHSGWLPVFHTQTPLPVFTINFKTLVTPVGRILAVASPHAVPAVWRIVTIIYLSGAFVVFARLIYQAIYLQAVSRLSEKKRKDGFTIVSTNVGMIPFSYFRRIYIPTQTIDDNSIDSIIAHEKAHMNQHHYLDLFIIEMIAIYQWFNPIIWLYEKSLKEVHEYLADAAVLNAEKNPGKYQAILVNQAMGGPVFIFTNQFNRSMIKKRITMMSKLRTSGLAQLKALLFVPVMAILMMAFANPRAIAQAVPHGKQITVKGRVTDKATGKGLEGSAVIIQGTTSGTLVDAGGFYSIIVPEQNATLAFSHVGYESQCIAVRSNTVINVELGTSVLALDFSQPSYLDIPVKQEQTTEKNKGNTDEVYVIVEDEPKYPGGTEALHNFLMSNLRYPENATKEKVEGIVLVQYVIDKEGKVQQAKIMRGISPEIDQEALRLTNSIKGWKPATQHGKPIETVISMPIQFSLK